MSQKKQHYLLNRAEEATNLLKKHLEMDNVVRIISHNDSDGISAAGIMCNAISKENGKFHVTIVPRLREGFIDKLSQEKYKMFVFCDMGSSRLDSLGKLKADLIIADHHQILDSDKEDTEEGMVHVNPHLFGMNGTQDLSASGVSYLIVREMDNKKLANLALVGAFGDMQGNEGFAGVNKMILDEGLEEGVLELREDLKLPYQGELPIYKVLAYTFKPALPGLSGDMEGCKSFLEKHGLSYGIKFTDLSNEEKDTLKNELIKLNPKIFGEIYSAPSEIPPIRNLEDYSQILDACGKSKKHGVGLSICLGERDGAVREAEQLLKKYRDDLLKGIEWIRKEGSVSLENIQYIYTEDKKKKGMLGTISTVGLELRILDVNKPVLGISRMDNLIKISARTIMPLVKKGVNLGYALGEAAKSFNGGGGGHNIAAGAVVPFKEMDNFTDIVDEIVGTQINP